jgi:putative hydrolase of the HAD superfamily
LDSCLSAANEVGDQLFKPAFDAIRRANHGAVSEDSLKQAFSDCWRFPFNDVAHKYGFTEEMTKAGFAALAEIEVTEPMHGYGDLHVLRELHQKLFLVTSDFGDFRKARSMPLVFENSLPKSESMRSMSPDRMEKRGTSRRSSNRIP